MVVGARVDEGASPVFLTVSGPGGGGTYQSTDQTAHNAAIFYANAAGGGTVYVKDFNYTLLGPLVFVGSNVIVIYSGAAFFTLPANATLGPFLTPNHSGGGATWAPVAVTGSLANCEVYGGPQLINLVPSGTNGSISGWLFGGLTTSTVVVGQRSTTMTRWARHFGAYVQVQAQTYNGATVVAAATYDGSVSDCHMITPWSSGCGNTGVPDGGGMKYVNGSTAGTVTNCDETNPTDLNFHFASWDCQWTASSGTTSWYAGIRRIGGSGTAASDIPAGGVAVFVEASAAPFNWGFEFIGGFYTTTTQGTGIGLSIGISALSVKVLGGTFDSFGQGGQLVATGSSSGGGHTISGTHFTRNTNGFIVSATSGVNPTVLDGVLLEGLVIDDLGAGVAAVGMKWTSSGVLNMRNVKWVGGRVVVKGGGTLFDISGYTAGANNANNVCRDVGGISPQGYSATIFAAPAIGASPSTVTNTGPFRLRARVTVIGNAANTIQGSDPAGNLGTANVVAVGQEYPVDPAGAIVVTWVTTKPTLEWYRD